jgi:pimeloyl-ACP methyl ester carboxylesterase
VFGRILACNARLAKMRAAFSLPPAQPARYRLAAEEAMSAAGGLGEIERTVVAFAAGDGMQLNLIHLHGPQPATRGPVLLVHGAGVRANLFLPPTDTTIVATLLEHGYDVWLENWRASIDVPPNPWTLDKAALYDHPKAVETVVQQTGADRIKAIIHCQGSTSFMMSAVAGLVPQVKTIVSNAVALHPRIPDVTRAKFRLFLPILSRLLDYLDPQWGKQAPTTIAKLITTWVKATHHECDNTVCRLVSFTYGVGFPTLWSHANLNVATHDWISQEFAKVPVSFFQQMYRCVLAGHLVSVDGLPGLPASFGVDPPQTDARFVFFAGQHNHCFLPESQQDTFDWFNRQRPGFHGFHVFPNYGHLDVFIGKDAARDTFPLMIAELDKDVS